MSGKHEEVQDVLRSVIESIDAFCREHLNEEYAILCRSLAEKLALMRPSPLLTGKPNAWACGIVRTIGLHNFLGDKSQTPYMKISDISKAFGVGESTAVARSATIRSLLNLSPLDFEWQLPSRIDDNPLIWMLSVNGFVMDIRNAPRGAQEVAFEQGLIPYIPADREDMKSPTTKKPKNRSRTAAKSKMIYQFKITLVDSQPPIWRRIQIADCTLDKLHEHIQTAMGWTNSHLHRFEISEKRFGDPELLEDDFEDLEIEDSTSTLLSDVLPADGKRFQFTYEYDFGDYWQHEILFEGCLESVKGTKLPICLEGERACPPENCGGVEGYEHLLDVLSDPKHEEHSDTKEWVGGKFDPNQFDPVAATKAMKKGLPDWRNEEDDDF